MTITPLRRRLERLERGDASWRAYAQLPGEQWPDEALDAYLRECCPEMFRGRPADVPITDDELRQIVKGR
jgi:hypothetical protein